MATTNSDGSITVQSGDTLSGIYGSDWQTASGYTGNPSSLPVGTVLPAPKTSGSAPVVPTVPTIVDSSHLGASTTPPIPTGNNTLATGTPSNTAQTALDSQNPVPPTQTLTSEEQAAKTSANTISSNIVNLDTSLTNKAADTTAALATAGVPQLTQQLQTLNNTITQKTADLATYDANQQQIQNNISQQPVAMSIITGQQAEQARQSAITRASMVSEIGMYNAQVQATQGNITLATKTAQDAIDAKYQPILDQIQIQKDQLAAIQPLLTSADAKDAANQSLKISQYQNQIAQQKTDEANVAAVALEAANNGAPSDVVAAIGKATDQTGALSAAKGYLSDTTAKAIQVAQLTKLNLENAAAVKAAAGGSGNVVLQNPVTGAGVNVSSDLAPYVNFSSNGNSYMDASTLEGTAAQKSAMINEATTAGLKVITNKNTATDLGNIRDATNKLNSISTIMAGLAQPSVLSRDLGGLGLTKLATLTQSDPQKAAAGALSAVGLDMLKALSGVQGFRGNTAVVQQINDHMPTIYDTVDTVNQKVAYIQGLISDREDALVGAPANPPSMYAGITLPTNTSTGSSYAGITLPN